MEIQDLLIVGAGLTGLSCAHSLSTSGKYLRIQILEKSNGCGGRMATRRVGESKFDHGAQFIKASKDSSKLIDLWQESMVACNFASEDFGAICGQSGMTQLAKIIAAKLNIEYNSKVIRLEKRLQYWRVFLEQGEPRLAEQIILTCPLPQSVQILRQSDIDFDQKLTGIRYHSSIVILTRFDSSLDSEMNYRENLNEDIFSICSQKAKGLSIQADYTIVMQNLWSANHFDKSDDEICWTVEKLLNNIFPKSGVLNLIVKKWRFASPQDIWERLYENVANGLYLAGDAFGGPSLNGALRSSNHLSDHLMSAADHFERGN